MFVSSFGSVNVPQHESKILLFRVHYNSSRPPELGYENCIYLLSLFGHYFIGYGVFILRKMATQMVQNEALGPLRPLWDILGAQGKPI